MAAALCCPSIASEGLHGADAEQGSKGAPLRAADGVHPIHFLYDHLHNAIRTELDNLSSWVLALEADNEQDLLQRLTHLKERYHFLEQVYKYHSSVEDEVRLARLLRALMVLLPRGWWVAALVPCGQAVGKAAPRPAVGVHAAHAALLLDTRGACGTHPRACRMSHTGGVPRAGLQGEECDVSLQRGAPGRGVSAQVY
jgi:hypothetical protein